MSSSESSSGSEREILDPAHVEQLRGLRRPDGSTLLTDVVNQMLKETPQRLADMKLHLAEGQTTPMAALAHKIAGSAGSVGAVALRLRAQALEKTVKMLEFDELPRFFDQLEQAWLKLKPELAKLV